MRGLAWRLLIVCCRGISEGARSSPPRLYVKVGVGKLVCVGMCALCKFVRVKAWLKLHESVRTLV